MRFFLFALFCYPLAAQAQEATSGFEFHATITGAAAYSHELTEYPREGAAVTAGIRALLYPTWKFNENWSLSGALEMHSRPFYYDEFYTQGQGMKMNILRLHLTYSRIRKNRSLVVRVGQLSSAFGSFLLRYDDAVNPLIQMPLSYGYYGAGVTVLGLAGAQVDATVGKLDMRAQFVNSSPGNQRSIFDRDQYGAWVGGAGYTLTQGFRIGVSAYRGPYLDRQSPFYFPGEARPRDLPGSGYGLEAQWARGHWNAYAELQKFQFAYRVIPTFNENTGYAELRRVLGPRWYIAERVGYVRYSAGNGRNVYESAVGFRPNRYQLFKVGYEIQRGPDVRGTLENICAFQFVTAFRPVSIARD